MLGDIWLPEGPQLLELPVFVWSSLLLGAVQDSMLFKVPLCVSLLCHTQNNSQKSLEKELFSPFKNRKGIDKMLGPIDKANISVNVKKSFCMWLERYL